VSPGVGTRATRSEAAACSLGSHARTTGRAEMHAAGGRLGVPGIGRLLCMEHHIERLQVQTVAVIRAHVAVDGIPAFLASTFAEVIEVLAAQGLGVVGPPFARYGMSGRGFDVEAGLPSSARVRSTRRVEAGELPS